MKILRVQIVSADTCGGLLDGFEIRFRSPTCDYFAFDPLCLVGPNGTGKSQLLQVLAEIFQSIYHVCVKHEERIEGNPDLQFEIEYLIQPTETDNPKHIRVSRKSLNRYKPRINIEMKRGDEWIECDPASPTTHDLLPTKVIGYSSGENETLSLPFLISRSGYADEVGRAAFSDGNVEEHKKVPDTRLMLIDYGTNLEVVVSNLLTHDGEQLEALLKDARLNDINSIRIIIQLAHSAAPKLPARSRKGKVRKRIQLTNELENYIENLQRCATQYTYDDKKEIYIFDFLVDVQTKTAFRTFWESTFDLYSSFHKLSMLNDLAIPKVTRERFRRDTRTRRFASQLPEPQDEDKVFRFDQVDFINDTGDQVVDYVALSDGEHQLGQILGTFLMVTSPNVLFLLDEPESHFNPQWRVKFIEYLLNLPTENGLRKSRSSVSQQECLLTTHAPFVLSDMQREKVFIFSKENGRVVVRHPDTETYGTTFDNILDECFEVKSPIAKVALSEIETMMRSENPDEIKDVLNRLGHSVEKIFLADRFQQLTKEDD